MQKISQENKQNNAVGGHGRMVAMASGTPVKARV